MIQPIQMMHCPSRSLRMLIFVLMAGHVSANGAQTPAAEEPRSASPAENSTTSPAESPARGDDRVPHWAAEARWYYIVVPRFANGDKENDPEGTTPWSRDWPTDSPDKSTTDRESRQLQDQIAARRYGGDLKGVIERLPYLKELGVNALFLSPVFHGAGEFRLAQVDLRHVDPAVGVKGSLSEATDEKADPASWVWTSSDKLLLELIRRAHEAGMRVAVSGLFHAVASANAPPAEFEAYYLAATKRWMDPDGDGRPDDGVDGWFLSFEEGPLKRFDKKEKDFWSRWREAVRKVNPQAVVIGSGPLATALLNEGPFDVAISDSLGSEIRYFFNPANKAATVKGLFDAVKNARGRGGEAVHAGTAVPVSAAGDGPRLLTSLVSVEGAAPSNAILPGPPPDDAARARWRLATIFQHFCTGAPLTFYGDEAGMFGGGGEFARAPMFWTGVQAEGDSKGRATSDFFALVQWLHYIRRWYAPLRTGEFRQVLTDEKNKVLSFARSLPGDEVILVMNYGDSKQKVMLPAGKPGQLVAVFSPQVQPAERGIPRKQKKAEAKSEDDPAKVEPLGVGGSRQFVNNDGLIRLWVAPMSVRVVFVNDKEPRRE